MNIEKIVQSIIKRLGKNVLVQAWSANIEAPVEPLYLDHTSFKPDAYIRTSPPTLRLNLDLLIYLPFKTKRYKKA